MKRQAPIRSEYRMRRILVRAALIVVPIAALSSCLAGCADVETGPKRNLAAVDHAVAASMREPGWDVLVKMQDQDLVDIVHSVCTLAHQTEGGINAVTEQTIINMQTDTLGPDEQQFNSWFHTVDLAIENYCPEIKPLAKGS